jgi:hypothetical protein
MKIIIRFKTFATILNKINQSHQLYLMDAYVDKNTPPEKIIEYFKDGIKTGNRFPLILENSYKVFLIPESINFSYNSSCIGKGFSLVEEIGIIKRDICQDLIDEAEITFDIGQFSGHLENLIKDFRQYLYCNDGTKFCTKNQGS